MFLNKYICMLFVTPYLGYVTPISQGYWQNWASNQVVSAQRSVLNLYNQLNYDITRLNAARPGSRAARVFERRVAATENRLAAAENRLSSAVNTAISYGAFLPGFPGFTPGPFYYYSAAPVFLPRRPFAVIGPVFAGAFPGLLRPASQGTASVSTFGGSYNRNWS